MKMTMFHTGNRGFLRVATLVHRAWAEPVPWRDDGTYALAYSSTDPAPVGVPTTTVEYSVDDLKRWDFRLRYSPLGPGSVTAQLEAELLLGGASVHILEPVEKEPDIVAGQTRLKVHHFAGILLVEDQEAFTRMLLRGVGGGRRLGCGMLFGARA